MKTLYYDCFAGISGDMNLAALIDLGVDEKSLVAELQKLNLEGWSIETQKASRGGICGTLLTVHCEDGAHDHHHDHGHAHHEHSHNHHRHEHRSFAYIKKIICGSALSESVKEKSLAIFSAIAEAEAKVHGKKIDDVHFHEVGAVDSIIDIVGAAICAELLGVEKFTASTVELGGGTVRCQHGVMPVPAPATAEIAKAFPAKIGGAPHECTTPTGAAIIAALCALYNAKISGEIIAAGIGVGHRDSPALPNILRVMLIEEDASQTESFQTEAMTELCANIDDMCAEDLSELTEKLFAADAADVWQESIAMKKNRLAVKVCALTHTAGAQKIRDAFFKHSTTLGIREQQISRIALNRESEILETSFGKVRFKIYEYGGVKRAKPEFDDCKKISESSGIPTATIRTKLINEFERKQS